MSCPNLPYLELTKAGPGQEMGWQSTWQTCSLEVLAPGECAPWVGKAEGQAWCEENALPSPLCPSLLLLFSSHQVVSDSLWPHGLQHTRLPCASSYCPESGLNSCIWLAYSFSFLKIRVWLLYNVVLVSATQQWESALCDSPLYRFSSPVFQARAGNTHGQL